MENLLYIIIFIIIIITFFYLINILLKPKEHMTMKNQRLNKIFNDNGYIIDVNNYTIKKDNIIIKEYSTGNFNTYEAHKTAKNKPLTNIFFAKNNIPVPKHIIIDNKNKFKFMDDNSLIEYPCVLKPVDGMQGKDVNTFIKSKEQFNNILENLLNKYDKIMMENQVYGNNYRIFVFNDKIIDVVERKQPFIIGDGIKNLDTLIVEKNKLQKEKKLYPTNNLDYNFIEEQGYNKNSIVEKDKKVFITNTINFHNGANPIRINLENIPQKNKDMFIKAHKLIKLDCSGIDYMSDDITVPYDENEGHIIEINDMVDTKIHVDSDNQANPDFLFINIFKSFINNL
jgi:cyanophycin synthetase